MRCKEARELLKELNEVYDPAKKERHDRTHKPLFPKPEEKILEKPTSLTGSTPATTTQIRHVLYERKE